MLGQRACFREVAIILGGQGLLQKDHHQKVLAEEKEEIQRLKGSRQQGGQGPAGRVAMARGPG